MFRHVVPLSDIEVPISLYDMRCIAQCYLISHGRKVSQFKDNIMLGWDWSQLFLERNTAVLTQQFNSNISRKRAQVNEEMINNFFDNLDLETSNVLPRNIMMKLDSMTFPAKENFYLEGVVAILKES